MKTVTIEAGSGCYVEYRGNLTGDFKRFEENTKLEVLSEDRIRYNGHILCKLPTGERALVAPITLLNR